MGSIAAMHKGAKIKSEGEFNGKSYSERVLVAEGVEGLVPVKGSVKELVDQAIGGIKSGMYYGGRRDLSELAKVARFSQITQASLTESHPHSVLITNAGQNCEFKQDLRCRLRRTHRSPYNTSLKRFGNCFQFDRSGRCFKSLHKAKAKRFDFLWWTSVGL